MKPISRHIISHTHPLDGRHFRFFSTMNYESDNIEPYSKELDLEIDILKKDDTLRLRVLRQKLIKLYLEAFIALDTIEDKKLVLSLYLDAFADLFNELNAFYGEGIQSEATEDRGPTSFNVQDAKVNYWLNSPLRFVHAATHIYDSFYASFVLGFGASLLVFPFIIASSIIQVLPVKQCFSLDGDAIKKTNCEKEKVKILEQLSQEQEILNDNETLSEIKTRLI
jgi:hypothetical protein